MHESSLRALLPNLCPIRTPTLYTRHPSPATGGSKATTPNPSPLSLPNPQPDTHHPSSIPSPTINPKQPILNPTHLTQPNLTQPIDPVATPTQTDTLHRLSAASKAKGNNLNWVKSLIFGCLNCKAFMDKSPPWFVLLLLIGSVSVLVYASTTDDDFHRCESAAIKWAASELNKEVKNDKHSLRDLLFFLHIPRTGGRTYFHCFLKKLYSSELECPRSYDKLHFNPRKASCRLLVTHDDYSMTAKLPKEKTSIVTILRNPIDRVFSTYEFSIEVAARFLVHPNLTSATQMARRLRKKSNAVSTLDIWPWKYLVPWMREDLFSRRDARLQKSQHFVERSDSYNMEDMAMPLDQYINDPIAMDIVHNGATFQVAGLTNNSYLAESHEVRTCVQKYPSLGNSVLEVAKRRLDHMLYVGLTEDHKSSATTFAHVVGAQVISQLVQTNSSMQQLANRTEQSLPVDESESRNSIDESSPAYENKNGTVPSEVVEGSSKSMTVGELMDAYEVCIKNLRKSQSRRRTNSLMRISPVNFSKEARLKVPESTLEQISSLNRLDVELYKYAQEIFTRQHERMIQNLGTQDSSLINPYGTPSWRDISFGMAVILVALLLFLFVNARRKTSKIKI